MITPEERLEMFEKVKKVLEGIDFTQTDVDFGWWETSVGAEFGWRKIEELKEIILGNSE